MTSAQEFYRNSREHVMDECRRIVTILNDAAIRRLKEKPPSEGLFSNLFVSDENVHRIVCESEETDSEEKKARRRDLFTTSHAILEEIERKKKGSFDQSIVLNFQILEGLFGLSRFEMDALLSALLPEIHGRYSRVLGYLQDDMSAKWPTIGLIAQLFAKEDEEQTEIVRYFLSDNVLFHFDLLRCVDLDAHVQPISSRMIKIDDRVLNYILGDCDLDEALGAFAHFKRPIENTRYIPVSPEQKSYLLKTVTRHLNGKNNKGKLLINIAGEEGSGRETLSVSACGKAGIRILSVDMEKMVRSEIPFSLAIRKVFREGLLLHAAVYFRNINVLFQDESHTPAWRHAFFNAAQELAWIIGCSGDVGKLSREIVLDRFEFISISIPPTGILKRRDIWQSLLQENQIALSLEEVETLAGTYRFTIGRIVDAIKLTLSLAGIDNEHSATCDMASLREGCRLVSQHKLSTLGRKVTSSHAWDDLILPSYPKERLQDISRFIRNKSVVYEQWEFERKMNLGRGLNVMFFGPSGTGKTMAAGILAETFDLELYKIDLSSVVSKYIGETEKNLSKVFKEAELSNAVLFFDEADALFGKRTEIKDAHDRYANIEINYLLQKMEEHEGIIILATNMTKNMDDAFLRRMHFTVEFPFPDEKQRYLIWKNIFPECAPLAEDIDYSFLASRIKLAGGSIKNVAVASAFYAADGGKKITMQEIMRAVAVEYQKIGKAFFKADFEPHYNLTEVC